MSFLDKDKPGFAAIKIPTEHLNFIKRNPKISQTAGALMVTIADSKQTIAKCKAMYDYPEFFRKDLENGTEEELLKLLDFLKNNVQDAELYDDVPLEKTQQIVEKLRQSSDVVVTDFRSETGQNKEVLA